MILISNHASIEPIRNVRRIFTGMNHLIHICICSRVNRPAINTLYIQGKTRKINICSFKRRYIYDHEEEEENDLQCNHAVQSYSFRQVANHERRSEHIKYNLLHNYINVQLVISRSISQNFKSRAS